MTNIAKRRRKFKYNLLSCFINISDTATCCSTVVKQTDQSNAVVAPDQSNVVVAPDQSFDRNPASDTNISVPCNTQPESHRNCNQNSDRPREIFQSSYPSAPSSVGVNNQPTRSQSFSDQSREDAYCRPLSVGGAYESDKRAPMLASARNKPKRRKEPSTIIKGRVSSKSLEKVFTFESPVYSRPYSRSLPLVASTSSIPLSANTSVYTAPSQYYGILHKEPEFKYGSPVRSESTRCENYMYNTGKADAAYSTENERNDLVKLQEKLQRSIVEKNLAQLKKAHSATSPIERIAPAYHDRPLAPRLSPNEPFIWGRGEQRNYTINDANKSPCIGSTPVPMNVVNPGLHSPVITALANVSPDAPLNQGIAMPFWPPNSANTCQPNIIPLTNEQIPLNKALPKHLHAHVSDNVNRFGASEMVKDIDHDMPIVTERRKHELRVLREHQTALCRADSSQQKLELELDKYKRELCLLEQMAKKRESEKRKLLNLHEKKLSIIESLEKKHRYMQTLNFLPGHNPSSEQYDNSTLLKLLNAEKERRHSSQQYCFDNLVPRRHAQLPSDAHSHYPVGSNQGHAQMNSTMRHKVPQNNPEAIGRFPAPAPVQEYRSRNLLAPSAECVQASGISPELTCQTSYASRDQALYCSPASVPNQFEPSNVNLMYPTNQQRPSIIQNPTLQKPHPYYTPYGKEASGMKTPRSISTQSELIHPIAFTNSPHLAGSNPLEITNPMKQNISQNMGGVASVVPESHISASEYARSRPVCQAWNVGAHDLLPQVAGQRFSQNSSRGINDYYMPVRIFLTPYYEIACSFLVCHECQSIICSMKTHRLLAQMAACIQLRPNHCQDRAWRGPPREVQVCETCQYLQNI